MEYLLHIFNAQFTNYSIIFWSIYMFFHGACFHLYPMYDPNKHDSAKSARWIWGLHLLSLPLFLSCINSSSGEPERSVCQVLSPEKNYGKLNEAWTWEQPYPSFSRGCSKHIKGSISNVQNKWRLVKTPKDILLPATVSCCHKSQDPYAHSCVQTGGEML